MKLKRTWMSFEAVALSLKEATPFSTSHVSPSTYLLSLLLISLSLSLSHSFLSTSFTCPSISHTWFPNLQYILKWFTHCNFFIQLLLYVRFALFQSPYHWLWKSVCSADCATVNTVSIYESFSTQVVASIFKLNHTCFICIIFCAKLLPVSWNIFCPKQSD